MKRMISTIVLLMPFTLLCVASAKAEIEEVIVTATKRVANVQDVPIAVTALSTTQLEREGVDTLRDLSRLSSSFSMNTTDSEAGSGTFRIRGVGTTGNNIGLEQSVGVFLDGAYLSRPGVALGDLVDLEQIEVLRGPQGTLFGRNTSAGAISIKTKKASLTESESFVNVGLENFNGYNVQAGFTAPIIDDTLGFRLSGSYRKRDGFLEANLTDDESYTRDRLSLRSQLQWQINDDSSLRVIADYSTLDEACCDAVILGETPFAGNFVGAGLPADGGNPGGSGNVDDLRSAAGGFGSDIDQWGISAEYNWQGEETSFTYLGSYRQFETNLQRRDFVGIEVYQIPGETNGYSFEDDIKTMTHEFRFQGEAGIVDWMVGAYYQQEDLGQVFPAELGSDYQAHGSAVYFTPLFLPAIASAPDNTPLALGGTLGDVRASSNPARTFANNVDAAGNFAANRFTQEGSSWSVFTHNTLRVLEDFHLVLGIRYVKETKEGRFDQLDSFSPACAAATINQQNLERTLGAPAGAYGTASVFSGCFAFTTEADQDLGPDLINVLPRTFDDTFNDDELVYTAKSVYYFNDDINAYASFTHGFKSGGFNMDSTAAINGADPRFASEQIDSYEIGLKADLLDNSLRINAAIFQMEMEDYQVLEFTGSQFTTFNVDKAESEGYEVEVLWAPLDSLQLSSSWTHTEARYPGDCDGGAAGASASVSMLCGFSVTNAPEDTLLLGISYESVFPGTNFTYFGSASARYESDKRTGTQAVNAAGVPLAFDIQEAFTKVGVRFGIGTVDGSWTAEIWGNNLTNEITQGFSLNIPLRIAARGAFIQEPRTFGLTVRTSF